jgi:hypothetical protein
MSVLPEENTAQVKVRLSAAGDPQLPTVVEYVERRLSSQPATKNLLQNRHIP